VATSIKGPKTTTKYRWVGWHAQEFVLATGARPWVEPGGFIDMDDTDYNNEQNTILHDRLLDTTAPAAQEEPTTEEVREEVKT